MTIRYLTFLADTCFILPCVATAIIVSKTLTGAKIAVYTIGILSSTIIIVVVVVVVVVAIVVHCSRRKGKRHDNRYDVPDLLLVNSPTFE